MVIDAGHGGKDPGCHGKHFKEKDVALAVALKLGHYIEQNDKDVKVVFTRTTDTFVPLNERAEIANRNHADLFLCIHCNANRNTDASGAATYVMGLGKSNGNLEVSKRENASILYEKNYKQTYDGFDPNSDEANVLFAMYQNVYLQESLSLSTLIQGEYSKRINRTDNGVKQAGFLVLWRTAMPSLLTEIGFLTNPDEERKIGSQKGEDQIAEAIFLAFEQYKDDKDKSAFDPGAFNLSPLVLKNNTDTISTPAGNTASNVKETNENDSLAGTNPLKATPDTAQVSRTKTNPDTAQTAATPDRKRSAKDDSNRIKVNRMKEEVADMQKAPVKQLPVREPRHDTVAAPKQALAAKETIKSDTETGRLVYKVQFLVSSSPLSLHDSRFANLPQVAVYMDNNIYKFTSGCYNSTKEAVDNQAMLRKEGYKDAFVVTFRDGKRVFNTKLSAK
ncbi:MAG: N-acetylmuramoyl-L-alanine amidase [Bacteroidia bacterium]|nr:N-acetylmuramoyl-L-alanine amidase [Bacteroidia bacterium]